VGNGQLHINSAAPNPPNIVVHQKTRILILAERILGWQRAAQRLDQTRSA
jgi:hypothetical protein